MTAATLPAAAPAPTQTQTLDDVMLAMDIVDTLRHRELVLERELGGEAREEALIKRLKEIYQAQGIDVPASVLKDGVKALEEKRFVYEPPKDSFAIRLARIYIGRDRWLAPTAFIAGLALFATAAYEFGFDRPREVAAEKARIELTVNLPKELSQARDAALLVAGDDAARTRIETSYQDGAAAAKAGDPNAARAAVDDIEFLTKVLGDELVIHVYNREGENSGVFRYHVDAPDGRNYYLIVEALDARGRAQALEVTSEETRKTARALKWGVRVPVGEFNRVAADKADNRIIEDDVLGKKPKGALAPVYSIDAGGAILEW